MTKISDIIGSLEQLAPISLQEDFDNAGVQVSADPDAECSGVLVCLDITEPVIDEAIRKGCNMVVSHHPLIFNPLRQITNATFQERCVIRAVQNGITLYSAHTNLDNAPDGVNRRISQVLGLENMEPLGMGMVGTLPEPVGEREFVARVAELFDVRCVQHSAFQGRTIRRVAVCGGAGSFLISEAEQAGADCFITGEISYHRFFEAGNALLMALGHYQSEQFTKNLISEYVGSHFPELKVEMTEINTNAIEYFI